MLLLYLTFLDNVLQNYCENKKIHLSLFAARVLLSPPFFLPHCILRFFFKYLKLVKYDFKSYFSALMS